MVANHLLKELAAVQWPIKDFGATHVDLQGQRPPRRTS